MMPHLAGSVTLMMDRRNPPSAVASARLASGAGVTAWPFSLSTIRTTGRHDPCLLPRFVPMGEAMVALVLADHWLRWRAIRV